MTVSESNFKLRGIILVESTFKRVPDVVIDHGEKTETNFNVKSDSKDEKNLVTALIVKLVSKFEEKIKFEAEVTMVGLFEAENATKEMIDSFGEINAPAIIFPFIREHIISLTIKGGLPPVALPVVNFVPKATDTPDTKTKN